MYLEQFTAKLNSLLEYKYVLLKTRELLGEEELEAMNLAEDEILEYELEENKSNL